MEGDLNAKAEGEIKWNLTEGGIRNGSGIPPWAEDNLKWMQFVP
jgi:hypothetical protein